MVSNVLSLLLAVSATGELAGKAEAAFQAGLSQLGDAEAARQSFREAAGYYEALRQAGADNPELHLNQGNASYLAGDLPEAILAYRRGLRIAPTHPELQTNLALAREQVSYPQPGRFAHPAIEHRPPWLPRWPGVLLALTMLLYGAGCLTLTRWWMVRDGPWQRIAGWCFATALLPLAGAAWEEWELCQAEINPLVLVAADDVQLRKGNGLSYPPVVDVPLYRGVEARRLFQRSGWLQVELGSGEIGWLRAADCLVDE